MFAIGFRMFRRWMATNEGFLTIWLPLVVDASKLFALAGASTGLLLLVSYLSSVGAPLPLVDASSTFALLIIAAVYGFIGIIIGLMILFPFMMCAIPQKLRQHLRRERLHWKMPIAQRLERLGSEYVMFHSTEFLAIAAISVSYSARASLAQTVVAVAFAWMVGAVISAIRLYVGVQFEDRVKLRFDNRVYMLKRKLAAWVIAGSLARTFWCLIWFSFMSEFFVLLPGVRDLQVTTLGYVLTWAIFGLILALFYSMLVSVKGRIERLPLALFFFTLMAAIFYPSFAGRTVVRMLGIGGGIPVTFLVRTMRVGGSTVVAEERSGCLILNVGGQVIVQNLTKPSSERCAGRPPTLVPSHVDALEGISVYSTADIIDMTRYHDEANARTPVIDAHP